MRDNPILIVARKPIANSYGIRAILVVQPGVTLFHWPSESHVPTWLSYPDVNCHLHIESSYGFSHPSFPDVRRLLVVRLLLCHFGRKDIDIMPNRDLSVYVVSFGWFGLFYGFNAPLISSIDVRSPIKGIFPFGCAFFYYVIIGGKYIDMLSNCDVNWVLDKFVVLFVQIYLYFYLFRCPKMGDFIEIYNSY